MLPGIPDGSQESGGDFFELLGHLQICEGPFADKFNN
jgi:hypothetical protein